MAKKSGRKNMTRPVKQTDAPATITKWHGGLSAARRSGEQRFNRGARFRTQFVTTARAAVATNDSMASTTSAASN